MRGVLAIVAAALLLAAGAARADDARHIGVASCAGDNCHGAAKRFPNSTVAQDEYLIWKQKDKHRLAYQALTEPRGERIAQLLGLGKAEEAPLCLSCHADNVAPALRGPRFDISDGVGCESCHGAGGAAWLGLHISGASHKENVHAGLYDTADPTDRAEKCLSCHLGTSENFVSHRIMGAGHPPMPFELDTYGAIQPAHYKVDKSYVERKGRPNDIQIWAVGQAMDLKRRMELILDPAYAPKGVTPELALFDCQACHHGVNELQWQRRASTGLEPGKVRLYDATAVMLAIATSRVAPDQAKALREHLFALHQASAAPRPDYWEGVKTEAKALHGLAQGLATAILAHDFDRADALAIAKAIVAEGDLDYSGAQQETMALESVAAAMTALHFADDAQVNAINASLGALYTAVANDQTYRPEKFVAALRGVEASLPR